MLIQAASGAFGTVVWVVCIVAAVIAVLGLVSSQKTWDELGRGRLTMDSEITRSAPTTASGLQERDEEIRQMLEARNARRRRRGEPPIDIEAELRRLTAPHPDVDPELRREIRDLVKARSYRRVRAGKPPLDVEAEVEREISRLGEL